MALWETLQQELVFRRVLLAILGAMLGSFASAAIYRIPREGLSVWRPMRSFCTRCQTPIRWYDNLPVLGYLLLRGRCRACGVRYGVGYMVHELVLAALFVLAGETWLMQQEGPAALLLALIALTALWIATVIDWHHLILPDGITLGGIPFGLVAAALVPAFHLGPALDRMPWGVDWLGIGPQDSLVKIALVSAILGSSISWALLIGIRVLFSYILRQEALGLGDVKYLAAVGAFLGLEGAAWTLLIGVFAGAVLGLLNIVRMTWVVASRRRRRQRTRVLKSSVYMGWLLGRLFPFGPPLVLGTVLTLLAPDAVRVFFLETWPNLLLPAAP